MHGSIRLALGVTIGIAAQAMGVLAFAEPIGLNQTSAGYTYFYRPGADMRAHDADVALCRTLAIPTVQPGRAAWAALADPYNSDGYWERMQNADQSENRLGREVNLENCMVAKGWRVVAADPAKGAAMLSESRAARLAEIASWVGDTQPHGVIVRSFDNEALNATTPVFAFAAPRGRPLDVDPLPPATEDFVRLDPDDPGASTTTPLSVSRLKPAAPESLRLPGQNSGVVAIALRGHGRFRLVFERVDAEGRPPSDRAIADFTVAQAQIDATGPVRFFKAPPGHWRIAGMAQGPYLLNLCMGAPAFYLAPGAVVYAGAFDPDAPSRAPDMSLAAPRAALPPGSPLSNAIQPADWRNGSVGRCRGAYIYALEFPGRPFVDGYRLGSLATATAP